MAEVSLVTSHAVIHHYDSDTKSWVPTKGPEVGRVDVYANHGAGTYRVIGRSATKEVAINSNIWKNLSYNQVTEVWHQWTDRKRVTWGLNFRSAADASAFGTAMLSAVADLKEKDRAKKAASGARASVVVDPASRPSSMVAEPDGSADVAARPQPSVAPVTPTASESRSRAASGASGASAARPNPPSVQTSPQDVPAATGVAADPAPSTPSVSVSSAAAPPPPPPPPPGGAPRPALSRSSSNFLAEIQAGKSLKRVSTERSIGSDDGAGTSERPALARTQSLVAPGAAVGSGGGGDFMSELQNKMKGGLRKSSSVAAGGALTGPKASAGNGMPAPNTSAQVPASPSMAKASSATLPRNFMRQESSSPSPIPAWKQELQQQRAGSMASPRGADAAAARAATAAAVAGAVTAQDLSALKQELVTAFRAELQTFRAELVQELLAELRN